MPEMVFARMVGIWKLAHAVAHWFRRGSSLEQSEGPEHLNRLIGFRRAMTMLLEF